MEIISLDRGQGKTTHLIRWLQIDPYHRAVLVGDESRAQSIRKALLVGYSRHTAGTSDEFVEHVKRRMVYVPQQIHKLQGRNHLTLAIDDLEYVLFTIVGQPITKATMGPIGRDSTVTWEDE